MPPLRYTRFILHTNFAIALPSTPPPSLHIVSYNLIHPFNVMLALTPLFRVTGSRPASRRHAILLFHTHVYLTPHNSLVYHPSNTKASGRFILHTNFAIAYPPFLSPISLPLCLVQDLALLHGATRFVAGTASEVSPPSLSMVITRNLYSSIGLQTFIPHRLLTGR
jgi:hypothetical protein